MLFAIITFSLLLENNNDMAGANNDYGKKGIFFGKAVLGIAIFIILIIWIYWKNQSGLN